MEGPEWGLIALTGLFSAPHCIAMCGGIVSAVTLQSKATALESILYYNLGRIVSYSVLGAVMGTVGSFVEIAGKIAGLQGLASIIGGLFVLLWLWRRFQLPFLHRWTDFLYRSLKPRKSREKEGDAIHIAATGLSFGFLPCGLTYAMQMNAAASGSAWEGAAIMAVFGVATLPALLVVALFIGRVNKRWRKIMRQAGTIAAVLVGLLAIMRGLAANDIVPSLSPWLW
ncbi:hypothetical protein PAECIP111893_00904 [Paenibacillus plantiphilus]|uniref:Urease accessory protein UreH-like transmembrane domain-containing protein n=1 Tax=Paenibacillus plantiphilus TaxID=2905650 RepID=A0ABN8GB75_9BACL|nr:sulfite exporter TauE/SafE family protein [Paenibacillus plantiphilus]CAH1197714.1 hypothetical protein PAECIP111893_00904 [Paenibacillus plantiphilus]